MRVLRFAEVLEKTGLSASTLRRLEGQGRFPPRRRLGESAIGWTSEDVDGWIESLEVVSPQAAGIKGEKTT